MSTVYRCDKCKKESTKKLLTITMPMINRYTVSEEEEKTIDLCDNCIKELDEFLKPLPEIGKL